MQSQKSEAEKCLEEILRDQEPSIDSTLVDLLPQTYFTSRSEEIKRNISDFIEHCLKSKKLVKEMIDRGVKSHQFASQYQKNLALFSVEILSGEYGDTYKIFIEQAEQAKQLKQSKTLKNESQIEQQIEMDPVSEQDQFNRKYSNFMYLLQYIRQPETQISEINMSYFTKIISNIITNRVEEVYAYFQQNYHAKNHPNHGNEQQNNSQLHQSDLQYLIKHAYNFGGVSEVLGKMLAEEGPANKYIEVKKRTIQIILNMLRSEELIKQNTSKYHCLIQFVSYLLSRTKYRSDDQTEQIAKISQRFVDQNVVWYFKQKLVKAVIDSNSLITSGTMNSSGNLNRSESSKSAKKQYQLRPQNEQQFRRQQIIFENALGFLQVIVERINYEEQMDKFENEDDKPTEPVMDFQVDEAIFGQNSLFQLFTLSIPSIYKSINKMSFYEFLLKLTRNSRYKNPNPLLQTGILQSFVTPILIHLLKVFKRESRKNGLVNFYVQQLICEAVLSKVSKFQTKQAMMVLSALDPSQDVLNRFDDTRAFTKKLLIIMANKCQWFEEHFLKLGLNLKSIKQNYKVKLAGNSSVLNNRKNIIKQFQFLQENEPKESQSKSKNQIQKSDRFEDGDDSSGSEKELQQFDTRRQFSYPQNKSSQEPQKYGENSDLEQNLFKSLDNEIMQQIQVTTSSEPRPEPQRKQSQIELLVDSAEQDDQVTREDMNLLSENPPN